MTDKKFMGGNESPTGYDRNKLAREYKEKHGNQRIVTRRQVKNIRKFLL